MNWKPIETAPKETMVLLAGSLDHPTDWRIKVGYYSSDLEGWHIFGGSWAPSHWMPLPAPPAS